MSCDCNDAINVAKHQNKHIREAIKYAEEHGWTLVKSWAASVSALTPVGPTCLGAYEPTSMACCIAPAMIATGIVLTYTRRRGIPKHTLAIFAGR
jgi:hypothetical protein